MITEKLYNANSYLKEFDAKVIEVVPFEDKQGIVLDRTAFYPEGGGQPSDTGYLNEIKVTQVIEENGKLLHVIESPLQTKEVKGQISWSRRFDHMQQHTGQHILSACFQKLMDGSTDSFHLGKDIVSIEIGIDSFSTIDAERIENMANEIIYNNIPVTARFVSDEELQSIPLRKKPKVTENIRVVEVKDFDYSPCGGTHVSATGEIGIIKIKSWEKCKGGFRFVFVCGYRALRDYNQQLSITKALSEKLSARDFEIEEAFSKTMDDFRSAEKQLAAATHELLKLEAEKIAKEVPMNNGVRIISRILEGRSINDAKILAQYLTQLPGTIALLTCRNENAQVIFTRSEDINIDMNSIFKSALPIIDGKGGGNTRTAQGGGSKIGSLEEFLTAAVNMVGKCLS